MYNEDLKQLFIQEKMEKVVLPLNYLKTLFNKTAQHENFLNKDISNFTTNEIIDFYKIQSVSSFNSLTVMNCVLSSYNQWCLNKNLVTDSQNHFLEITPSIVSLCVNKNLMKIKYITREKLLSEIEMLPNPSDKFVILGLFEGIKGKDFDELININVCDIDDDNVAKLCSGKKIKISKELRKIAIQSQNEYQYFAITGKQVDRNFTLTGDNILKDMYNASQDVSDFQKGRRTYTKIKRSLSFIGYDFMMPNDLFTSGHIYSVNKLMRDKGVSNIYELISNYSEEVREIEKKYNITLGITYLHKYGELL